MDQGACVIKGYYQCSSYMQEVYYFKSENGLGGLLSSRILLLIYLEAVANSSSLLGNKLSYTKSGEGTFVCIFFKKSSRFLDDLN